jgi:hypothetical protein
LPKTNQDWLSFILLGVGSAVMVIKDRDIELPVGAPSFLASDYWSYVPFALWLLALAIILYFHFIKKKLKSRLKREDNRSFQNETVEIDGFYFQNCRFRNVKFIYSGGRFEFRNCDLDGQNSMEIKGSRAAIGAIELVKILGGLHPDFLKTWVQLPDEHFD